MRVAAVDTGTNSTRLLVADVDDDRIEAVVRRATVTRLGEGVDSNRRLSQEAIDRTIDVLTRYKDEALALGVERVTAVGTSALRDASDGRDFLHQLEKRFGWQTRLLTGDEEAEVTRLGVGAIDDHTLLLDIGGGSTEISAGTFRVSLDVGSVRLTDRYLHSDPPAASELEEGAAFVRDLLPMLDVADAVGVAGTVHQLQALAGDLTVEAVDAQLDRLAALPVAERRRVEGMDPERAPVIVAGALILREVLRNYGLPRIGFSERDLLDGIAQLTVSSATWSDPR